MKTFARSAKALSLLATLAFTSAMLAGGCAVDPQTADETDDFEDEEVGEAQEQISGGYTIPRQYVGPVTTCPAGMEKIGALCYAPCTSGWVGWASLIGAQYCCPSWYNTPVLNLNVCYQRTPTSLTCAQGQEYINGSCYAACPAGCTSMGINGCSCTGGGG